jgi:subtilisin family serine protease
MAGPHVAGVVALLWSANSALVGDIGATEALICQTATAKPVEDLCTAEEESMGTIEGMFTNPICACGGTTGAPNNVYGCGVINAGEVIETSLEMR